MRASPAINSLNAGELSPSLEGRTDIAKYGNGGKLFENFIPIVQGPAVRRGGFRYVAGVKTASKRTWLIKFEFSSTVAYILEFGDLYVRFYTQHGVLLNLGVPYEIVSPYALADLTNDDGTCALKIVQSGDVLYIANMKRTYAPRKLTRSGTTSWAFTTYAPTTGPLLEQNADKTQALYVSAATGTITITAAKALFAATDVGRLVRIDAQNQVVAPWETNKSYAVNDLARSDGKTYKALNAATSGTSRPIHESGSAYDGKGAVQWQYQDAGYGIAQITAYTSSTQVTATVLTQFPASCVVSAKTITGATQANPCAVTANAHGFNTGDTVAISGVLGMTQLNGRAYQITVTGANTFTLDGIDSTAFTAYSSAGTAYGNASYRFQLGAWSATTEYPATVCFFRDRICWGGRQRLWLTVPNSFEDMSGDFFGETSTDNAIWAQLQAADVNDILWLVGADKLIIGTGGGEFVGGEITSASPLGPANFKIVPQSKRRCRAIQPVVVGSDVLFTQRAGRKLLSLQYAYDIDKYKATDMAILAERITRGGIVDMAYQGEPYSILWCVLATGALRGFTYDKDQDVIGWHRHPIGGDGIVESVCVVPTPDGAREEVWIEVKRTINGATVRTVEYLERPWEGNDYDGTGGDDQEDAFYVDSGLTYDGTPATTISGLSHLEGETVQILADGATHPDKTVSGGSITLDRSASVVQVGLQFTSKLITMRIEAGSRDGTSQGKIKRIDAMAVRFLDTLGGSVGMYGGRIDNISLRAPSTPMGSPPPITSGDVQVDFPGDYETDCRIEIRQEAPLPMTVAGIFPRLRTYDP